MAITIDLLTANEASAVSGVPIKAVYKLARERLPREAVVRKSGKMFLTTAGAVCVRLDRELPKDVPVKVRRALYRMVKIGPQDRIEYGAGAFRYVLETEPAANAVTGELAAYRRALSLITEDSEIQAGAATFKGTRILVHPIAELLARGVTPDEIKDDYPSLTDAMLTAAPLYARTHPKRGRPKAPTWRSGAPSTEIRVKRTAA
jgi:uncharacterized protein (DUF433 family)